MPEGREEAHVEMHSDRYLADRRLTDGVYLECASVVDDQTVKMGDISLVEEAFSRLKSVNNCEGKWRLPSFDRDRSREQVFSS